MAETFTLWDGTEVKMWLKIVETLPILSWTLMLAPLKV